MGSAGQVPGSKRNDLPCAAPSVRALRSVRNAGDSRAAEPATYVVEKAKSFLVVIE